MRDALRRRVGAAAATAAWLLACAPTIAAQATRGDTARERWTLGSPAADVRRIQGAPSIIQRLPSLGLELWSYGASAVRLSSSERRVIGWNDAGGTLRVRLRAGADTTTARAIAAGASRDDVIRLHGTPSAVVPEIGGRGAVWMFGRSEVRLGPAGRVASWSDADHVLRTRGTSSEARAVVAASDAPRPAAPATLDARIRFEAPAGDGVLEAGSRGTIIVTVTNRGPGIASGVVVRASPDSAAQQLLIGDAEPIATLPPDGVATVRVPISAADERAAGTARLRVTASEANGFDLTPDRRITIRTSAMRPVRFALAGVRVDDQSGDGRVSPREVAEITARVWNTGTGEAREASVRIVPGADVFLTQESPPRVSLGTMPPNAWRDISLTLYTNSRARSLAVRLELRDESGRWTAELPIDVPLDRPVASTLDVPTGAVGSASASDPSATPPALLDVVERDIPRGPRNPDAMAVVLGVERYRDLPQARWAARDAALVRRYAIDALGVSDDRNHLYVRTDADVTGNEFRKLFADDGWLARRVKPTTDLFVYWSGHGAADIATRTPYLIPFDGDANYARETGYSLATLYEQLARLDARSITVVVDACFTGLTRSHTVLTPGARPIVVSIEHPALRRENMAVFAAARGDQTASDFPPKRHGLFTYMWLDGLRGAADADGDRAITVEELEQYTVRRVREAAGTMDREQAPLVIARDRARVLVRLP